MKKCPTCNKTYSDDSMSFCLEDGAPLLTVGSSAPPAGFDPNLTIPFTPPRDTSEPRQDSYSTPPADPWGGQSAGSPPSGQYGQSSAGGYGQPGGSQSGQQGGQYGQSSGQYGAPASGQFPPPQSNQYQPAPSWSPQPSYATTQKKSSALPWVLGGIGLLVVLGVVGAVIIGVLASMSSNTNKNNSNNSNSNANRSNRNANSSNSNSANSNSNANSSAKPTISDDFSSESWWIGTVNVGTAWYQNGEYHLRSTSTGYMVVYGQDTYRTENATTRITARSVDGSSASTGFGLAVFGEMSKKKELEDYSFLIRTSATPAYKIVMHRGGSETVIVDWTDASQIRSGTSPNQLEVRASGTKAAFYINGQYVTTIEATQGYALGVAGVYTGGTEEVAFDDLQIFK